jgi:tripartite-type tricarboxylate transporter receptor subunit TctC
MSLSRRRFARVLLAAPAATALLQPALIPSAQAQAQAQAQQSAPAAASGQPISFVVPFAPGGIADITARPLAIPLARELGQSVVIENRAGAGGAVGMAHVTRQKPDGNTLLMALSSIVVIPEADKVTGKPPSYAMSQFTPIALVSADPTVLAVRTNSPWRTIQDLVRDAKSRPGKISFSSSGIYGTTHVAQAMLWQAAGIDMLHVPYNGGGPAMNALLGGQVDVTAQAPGVLAPHVKAGTIRLLGGWGARRLDLLPDVPTFKELGFDVEFYIWSGVFAPAGLAPAKLEQLRTAVRRSVQDPGFLQAMGAMNTPVRHMEGAEFDRFIEQDAARMAKVVKAMGKLE